MPGGPNLDLLHQPPDMFSLAFFQVAKLLLKRGASATCKDVSDCTAFDLAVKKGRLADEELFVALASEGGQGR